VTSAEVTSRTSLRSKATLTSEHLRRLADLADDDHEFFTRPGGRPEYRSRRVAVVLAQGAAVHYLHSLTGAPLHGPGVKDLDVWTFYAAIPGIRFPGDQRETHADFGLSALGRQHYDLSAARDHRERAMWQRWSAYSGRRVDFLMRAIPVQADAHTSSVVTALQQWLARGARSTATRKPSPWHLAQKAMVLIYPKSDRGDVVWPQAWGE
jgi:hypothetical protein